MIQPFDQASSEARPSTILPGTILVVEDEEAQRETLVRRLRKRNLPAEGAADAGTAHALAAQLGDSLAVTVLDIRLEGSSESGLDVGARIFRERKHKPIRPEFLVFSGYGTTEYYKGALELGVAAYLHKGDAGDTVLDHVSALHLRWALNVRLQDPSVLNRIALQSRTPREWIVEFCKEVLLEQLQASIGGSFMILLSDDEGTLCCATNTDLPEERLPEYHLLQSLTFGEIRRLEPFVVNDSQAFLQTGMDQLLLNRLQGAAFIPLSVQNVRLSVGVLEDQTHPKRGNAIKTATALQQYINSSLIEPMMKVVSEVAFIRSISMLQSLARFCSQVGREQLEILEEINDTDSPELREVHSLADDLKKTGDILYSLDTEISAAKAKNIPLSPAEPINFLKDFITVRDDLRLPLECEVSGDCSISMHWNDFYIILSRLLQWFSMRGEKTRGGRARVRIECSEQKESVLVFEDHSRRMPQILREQLFAPFAQGGIFPPVQGERAGRFLPLYLVQTLVEMRYKGRVEDCSDDISSDDPAVGHRFVLTFPKPVE